MADDLDDFIKVNTIFAGAVYMAFLDFSPTKIYALESQPECKAGLEEALNTMVMCQALSLTFFFSASMIGRSLKLREFKNNGFFTMSLDYLMFRYSRVLSMLGVVLLTLSTAEMIQMGLVLQSCESHQTDSAVAALSHSVIQSVSLFFMAYLYF